MRYAKIINKILCFPPKNKGGVLNYDKNVEQLIQDGYKEFIEAEKDPEKEYRLSFTETETQIIENADEIVPDPVELLKQAKEAKIQENVKLRDTALNQGVTYRDILFDSDTVQKVNLLATVSMMEDTDTIEWYGMNNDSLECTKEDLLNIGGLITQLHTFCWTKNAEIKELINIAETIEEVKEIEIDYSMV